MTYIAWDIETCPIPSDRLSDAQKKRRESEIKQLRERRPNEMEEALCRQACSFHPHLGWICCISAVRGDHETFETPKSWTASFPGKESDLLDRFWADVHAIGKHHDNSREKLQWVTFNGKRFDVPFLTARTVANGLAPTREDITDKYPYNPEPHADLMGVWPRSSYSLEGLCGFLGVETPKDEIDGSMVMELTREGRMDKIAEYCEGDAIATLRCAQELSALL